MAKYTKGKSGRKKPRDPVEENDGKKGNNNN